MNVKVDIHNLYRTKCNSLFKIVPYFEGYLAALVSTHHHTISFSPTVAYIDFYYGISSIFLNLFTHKFVASTNLYIL